MWEFIDNLRKQPEETKHGVALFLSSIISGVLLISWFVLPEDSDKNASDNKYLLSPFRALKNPLSAGIKDIGENFSEMKNSIKKMPTVLNNVATVLPAVDMKANTDAVLSAGSLSKDNQTIKNATSTKSEKSMPAQESQSQVSVQSQRPFNADDITGVDISLPPPAETPQTDANEQ